MTRNFFEHNPLKRLPHPADIPDISPSDFYLSGKVKGALIGQEIPDESSLLDTVAEILNGISTDEFQHICRSWIERVENVITTEGAMHPSKSPACNYLMLAPLPRGSSNHFMDSA
jgi:hypothetical protein